MFPGKTEPYCSLFFHDIETRLFLCEKQKRCDTVIHHNLYNQCQIGTKSLHQQKYILSLPSLYNIECFKLFSMNGKVNIAMYHKLGILSDYNQ